MLIRGVQLELPAEIDIYEILGRQYHASLEMLRQAILKCPESLWLSQDYPNRFWHVAYHALFYAHFYLQGSEKDVVPWAKTDYQYLGRLSRRPDFRPKLDWPCTREEVLEYHRLCLKEVGLKLPSIELSSPSGFPWLPFSNLEVQLYSIRHLEHHTGQLIDRLRTAGNIGIAWVTGN